MIGHELGSASLDLSQSPKALENSSSLGGGLSIIVPYFNSAEELEWMLAPLMEVKSDNLELIIVDDHSHSSPPIAMLENLNFSTAVVRISRARKWGMTGAANWGVVFASKPLMLKMDIDHRISWPDIERILRMEIDSSAVILFARVAPQPDNPDKMVALGPHSNSFLCHRHTFLSHGFYDERFSGHYGFDDKELFSRLKEKLQVSTDSSIALEMRHRNLVHRRSRIVNKLRLRIRAVQRPLAPRRLVDDAQIVFKVNF